MAKKSKEKKSKKIKTYHSLLQLKEELFPQMVEDERMVELEGDYKQLGIVLANKSIDKLISQHQ